MATSRDRILEALQDLPPDATFDDAIERLVFLAKIDAGLAELDEGRVVYRLRPGLVEIATVFRGTRTFPDSLG